MNYKNIITVFYFLLLSTYAFSQCPGELRLTGSESKVNKSIAVNHVASKQSIEKEADVVYQAGKGITLSPGFHAEDGSTFHAYIELCTTSPDLLSQDEKEDLDKDQSNQFSRESSIDQSDKTVAINGLNCQPNPFQNSTTIVFELGQVTDAELSILDMNGRRVKQLVSGELSQGMHQFEFTAEGLAPGVYLARLILSNEVQTVKMMLTK